MMQDAGRTLFSDPACNAHHHHAMSVTQMTFITVQVCSFRANVLCISQNARPETVLFTCKVHPVFACDSAKRLYHLVRKTVRPEFINGGVHLAF